MTPPISNIRLHTVKLMADRFASLLIQMQHEPINQWTPKQKQALNEAAGNMAKVSTCLERAKIVLLDASSSETAPNSKR